MIQLIGTDGKPVTALVGNVAHDAVDSGNPVKVGGRASSNPGSVAAGDRVNQWYGLNGQSVVALGASMQSSADGVGMGNQINILDAASNAVGFLPTILYLYNGTTQDRARGDATSGQYVGGAVAHDAVDSGFPLKIGGKASTSPPTAVAVNDRVNAWLDTFGIQQVTLRDTAGAAISTGIQYVEDVALAANAAQGTLVVARRDDALSTLTPIEGDAIGLRVNSMGALWSTIAGPSGEPLVVNDGGSITVVGTVAAHDDGLVAHDAGIGAPTDNKPVLVGGRSSAAAPTVVSADDDAVLAWFLRSGALVNQLSAAGALIGGDAANGLDVDVTRSALPTGAATETSAGAAATSLAILDDWDESDRAKVNLIAGQVGVAGGAGAVSALTQRVIIATDQTAIPVTGGGGGTQYVGDAAATATPTGTISMGLANAAAPTDVNANNDAVAAWFLRNGAQATVLTAAGALIGGDATNGLDVDVTRLPALVAGTANIGDVDVLTVPADPFGVNADAASATGSISAKLRFIAATGIPITALPALVAGSAAIGKLAANSGVDIGDVDVLTLPNVTLAAGTNTNEVVGDAAEDAALAGNPVRAGWRASTAIPTAMSADNDIVTPWANRSGAPVVTMAPHVGLNSDPWNLVHEAAQYTGTQTSAVLITGGASEKIVVTKVQIQVGGTTAGTLQLYFGTGAFARGTNRAVFDGEFAPSATSKPGVVMDGPFISGTNGDDLLVTTSAAINPLTINVWYYVIT